MRFFIAMAFIFLSLSSTAGVMSPSDSVGVEKIHGKVFILHRVEEKETLYSLSKRYNIPIPNIITANPKAEFGLDIGEILRVPYVKTMPAEDGRVIHEVKPSETLYSISGDYNVSVEDIKKWNHMSMNILDIGQELILYPEGKEEEKSSAKSGLGSMELAGKNTMHTVVTGETLYSISREYDTPLDKLREWNHLMVNDISIGQELIVRRETLQDVPSGPGVVKEIAPNEKEPETDIVATRVDSLSGTMARSDSEKAGKYSNELDIPMSRENDNFEEVEEDGLAQLIDGTTNNRKYLALHRTAKVGTIMRVRNEMNGQEVFVRVIGQLPDTGANRNILIKISKSAFDQLGAIDNRFRVRISFIP